MTDTERDELAQEMLHYLEQAAAYAFRLDVVDQKIPLAVAVRRFKTLAGDHIRMAAEVAVSADAAGR